MRGDVTMYSTRPLIGCDLARFGEGWGMGARSLAERGKFTQSSSFVTHSAIYSGNACLRKKMMRSLIPRDLTGNIDERIFEI